MALHHRPEIQNMRHAYGYETTSNRSSASSLDSDGSFGTSHQDTDTSYPTQSSMGRANSIYKQEHGVDDNRYNDRTCDAFKPVYTSRPLQHSPSSSADTYATTVPSEDDFPQEAPEPSIPNYAFEQREDTAVPATPTDFSRLFPSRRQLLIRHDDSTLDGNMNLRIDTEVQIHGRHCDMTLFHLRMHDLKAREFSLRRYCRDSGREVCRSTRKCSKPTKPKRPGFQRSLSNALNSIRSKSDQKISFASLQRNDSGYGSMHSVDFDEVDRPRSADDSMKTQSTPMNNTVKLEFSNYAQVEVKRSGAKDKKRYEFEYWGRSFSWRRILRKDCGSREVSYQLSHSGSERVLAHIVPVALTTAQAQDEHDKGGWIPPCTMSIIDEGITNSQKDIADVVVASGLMALVDDAIRARFHPKRSTPNFAPAKSQWAVQYVGPKRIITEMFSRKGSVSSQNSRPPSSGRPWTAGSSTCEPQSPVASLRQFTR